jgi:hypothetical protein
VSVVLEQAQIIEEGKHQDLLEKAYILCAKAWRQQIVKESNVSVEHKQRKPPIKQNV